MPSLPEFGAPLVPAAFLGAGPWAEASWALFGAPLDATVTFRPGSRFGPGAIRAASPVLEDWSPVLRRSLRDRPFCDLGDLEFIPGDTAQALAAIESVVAEIARQSRRPLMLGGEHLVTLGAVRALARVTPDLMLLQFDAHADLRVDYLGNRLSHATVMRRSGEVLGPSRLFQLGIRSGTAEEWAYAEASTHLHPGAVDLPEDWRGALRGHPVYVTVDIDSVDPAFAPGTGTPEPGGPSSAALLAAIDGLVGLDIVGADVVEVAPAYDGGGQTAVLAAKVVRELLLL